MLLLPTLRQSLRSTRSLSTSSVLRASPSTTPAAVPIALISKIRSQRPGTPLSLARSALQATANDLPAALVWLTEQAALTGAVKAEKLAGRAAEQGLVGVAVLADGTGGTGVRAAMVELRCETDFVARTDEFRELVEGVARSLAFFAEEQSGSSRMKTITAAEVADVPVVPPPKTVTGAEGKPVKTEQTVKSSIDSIVARLGENISLHRAVSLAIDPSLPDGQAPSHLVSSYLHGSKASTTGDNTLQAGTIASFLLSRLEAGGSVDKVDVKKLTRALARQVVAVPTDSVEVASGEVVGEGEQSKALYQQPLMTLASSKDLEFAEGAKVGEVLGKWSAQRGVKGDGLKVLELLRWEVGGE